jgi:hypothetical protein
MIQPGQIDYQKQLDSLKDLPVNEQSIEYLTELSRNPGSPFVRFLVESRLEQLTKALQNQAGAQAQQAQENSPQGTISDKIQQAAGLAALQSGQQRQAAEQMQEQASQAQMPVPQGIAQPQTQSEPDYGVASAPMDSEMFNFAPGGIVTFANPEKEKKQLVKDEEQERLRKQTEMYVLAAQEAAKQRALDEQAAAAAAPSAPPAPPAPPPEEKTSMAGNLLRGIVNPLMSGIKSGFQQTTDYGKLKAQRDEATPGFFEQLTPTERAARLKQTKELNAQLGQVGNAPAPAAPASAPTPGGIPTVLNKPASVSEAQATMLAGPQAAVPPSAPPPPPPPAVNTGIATGKPKPPPAPAAPAAPGAAPAAPTGIAATLAAMQNMPQQVAFNKAIEDARKASEGTTREQKIADELALQKALGVGTFEQQQMKMYEDNKARQDKIEAGRGQRDFLAQLATYARPGANWSQVAERDIASKAAALLEDQRFADSQNKLLMDIQRTAEERRVGTATSIRAAEALEKKTKQEMLTFIMKEMGVNLQVAQKILGDTLNAQVNMRGQDFQRQVGMANVDAKVEIAGMKADIAAEKLKATLGSMDTANKIKLSNSEPYKKLEARIAGLDQQIKYQTNPDGTPKNPEKMGKLKTDLADLKTQQATLAANILGTGGGISTLPQSTSTAGTKVIDFSKIK